MAPDTLTLAAKCRPDAMRLAAVRDAGIEAVELYTNAEIIAQPDDAFRVCGNAGLRYSVHAPTVGHDSRGLRVFVDTIGAEFLVLHDIYFEDEWREIAQTFSGCAARVCVENSTSIHQPLKFMRRYGFGLCLDMEHLQLEICGVFDEEFRPFAHTATYVHLTGYKFGTELWHVQLHKNPEHSRRMLDMLYESNYRGWVVSEARLSQQTAGEFAQLQKFFTEWSENATGSALNSQLSTSNRGKAVP